MKGEGALDQLLGLIVLALICGGIAAWIGQKKNLPNSFILGALLGIIGIIIVLCMKPGLPQAPPGMRAVKCVRCNTLQNVPQDQRTYECWQCKASNELWAAPPPAPASPPKPKALKSTAQTTKVRCHTCKHVQTVPVGQATFACEQCGVRLRRRQSPPNQQVAKKGE
jgi:predicted RNA-binding Zn-ribbon protein involved in translation (DUF1610 family)